MKIGIYANWSVVSCKDGFYIPSVHAKYLAEFCKFSKRTVLISNSYSEENYLFSKEQYEYVPYRKVKLVELPSFKNYFTAAKFFFVILKSFSVFVKDVDFIYVRTPEPFSWILPFLAPKIRINYHFTSNPFQVIFSQESPFFKKALKSILFYPEFKLITLAAWFKECSANGSSVIRNVPLYLRRKIKVLVESTTNYSEVEISRKIINKDFTEKKFLIVSRIQNGKGIEDVIKCFAEIKSKYNFNFLLTIVGDGPYRDVISKLTEELKMQDCVEFRGFVNNGPELDRIYIEHNFYINASKSETGPRTLIEAMSHGLYCISSDVGYVKTVLSDDSGNIAGDIFPPTNSDALYYKLLYAVSNNSERYESCSKLSVALSNRYTLNSFVRSVIEQKHG
ncbi:glycosyltransferase family 4 protein [Shewanella algae]|uniref:glycosyltransferase family 4 protein n=1 Tax=Shewanella algae TaxID=38313 RepID=UPI003AB01132